MWTKCPRYLRQQPLDYIAGSVAVATFQQRLPHCVEIVADGDELRFQISLTDLRDACGRSERIAQTDAAHGLREITAFRDTRFLGFRRATEADAAIGF